MNRIAGYRAVDNQGIPSDSRSVSNGSDRWRSPDMNYGRERVHTIFV
ncbi:hypothetical protein X975_15475, partial [Stegodyphus mimosarum]